MEIGRASGILLHPTSLPGRFGIGSLGKSARRFVDFLHDSSQQLWQIMPLGPTGYGDSPYQALSAFAGNPLLIDLEQLVQERCLAWWDLEGAPPCSDDAVDFGAVSEFKDRMLRLSWQNFQRNADDEQQRALVRFIAENRDWLEDFALYIALKQHEQADWSTWEPDIATRQPEALARWRNQLAGEIAYLQYVQFQFSRQWSALRNYANERGIRIIGDLPIFVSYDSADAWGHPEQFYFDKSGRLTLVAGVPPDFFSASGQRWGNPLYRWDTMAQDGYEWWTARLRKTLEMVDIVRLDHFRGFESCWAVPAEEETAIKGAWLQGPGMDLFRALEKALGPLPIIAEDLGLITPEVEALREELGSPGMKVLQFAFAGDADSLYLPHNHERNYVVYTGTHDNDTTQGWWRSIGPEERTHAQKYLARHGDDIAWDLIRTAMMSVCHTSIYPLQDVLNLGSEARMNTPGLAMGNWTWRYRQDMLTQSVSDRLREMTELYARAPQPLQQEAEEEP